MSGLESATGLAPLAFVAAALMTFAAAAIRGLTGFGMAIVLVPLLGMVMRPDQAVVLAIVLQLLIGPVGLRSVIADSHRRSALRIAAAAVLATPLGVWLLALTPPDLARVLIAGIALGAFALLIAGRNAVAIPGNGVAMSAGVAAGILTGFAGMPGPPVVPFYLREAFSPQIARASMLLVFFATAIAGTASAWLLGLLPTRLVWLGLFLFVPMVIGNALGTRAFGSISPPVWRSAVGLLLGVAGVAAVWRAF